MISTELYRNTFAEVSLGNLKKNIKQLQLFSKSSFFCPMVKSNAYGHGDKEVVNALMEMGVTTVGVALVEEASRLREYGFKDLKILIFSPIKLEAIDFIVSQNITPVISSWNELELFQSKLSKPLSIHIKFNTGMNRLGFRPSDAKKISETIESEQNFILDGVCTHLSTGENLGVDGQSSALQLQLFDQIKINFKGITTHAYNSSGFFAAIDKARSLNEGTRLGLSVYGCFPEVRNMQNSRDHFPNLKPVMTLKSEIIAYQEVNKGQSVSYGETWTASRPSVIGVVPIGYTDGYSRDFSNNGVMLFRDRQVSVVGKVCMDYTMIDVTDAVKSKKGFCGEEVIVFGQGNGSVLSLEELSEKVNKIPYEIITSVGRRVPRRYI